MQEVLENHHYAHRYFAYTDDAREYTCLSQMPPSLTPASSPLPVTENANYKLTSHGVIKTNSNLLMYNIQKMEVNDPRSSEERILTCTITCSINAACNSQDTIVSNEKLALTTLYMKQVSSAC